MERSKDISHATDHLEKGPAVSQPGQHAHSGRPSLLLADRRATGDFGAISPGTTGEPSPVVASPNQLQSMVHALEQAEVEEEEHLLAQEVDEEPVKQQYGSYASMSGTASQLQHGVTASILSEADAGIQSAGAQLGSSFKNLAVAHQDSNTRSEVPQTRGSGGSSGWAAPQEATSNNPNPDPQCSSSFGVGHASQQPSAPNLVSKFRGQPSTEEACASPQVGPRMSSGSGIIDSPSNTSIGARPTSARPTSARPSSARPISARPSSPGHRPPTASPSLQTVPEQVTPTKAQGSSGSRPSATTTTGPSSARSPAPVVAVTRGFDEDDPQQVFEESLKVLGEIEGLIKDSLNLDASAPLDVQDAGLLASVPRPLLDALEETLGVLIESRSQMTSVSASPASTMRGSPGGWGPVSRGSPGYPPGPRAQQQPAQRRPSSGASSSSIASSRGSRGPPPGGYMYQRLEREAREREEQHMAAAKASRQRPDYSRSPPPADWQQQQQRRRQEAEQKRLQQVQRDLAYIQQLRSKHHNHQAVHSQALEQAHHSIESVRGHATESQAQYKWMRYQDRLAEQARLEREYGR